MQRATETTFMRYPGPGHILRYVRLALDCSADEQTEGLVAALPDLCDDGGAVRLGVISMLADFAAGSASVRKVAPDWTVTHDMALHMTKPVPAGDELSCTCKIIRAGKNSVFSETSILASDGTEAARAYVTFTRLVSREGSVKSSFTKHVNLAEASEMPRIPLDTAVGYRFLPGAVEFDHTPFIINSLGAIQGGVIALTMERAASWAARGVFGQPARTTDLHLHYLALGKQGPFQARTEPLRRTANSLTSRIELVDTGDTDRLLAQGVATAEVI